MSSLVIRRMYALVAVAGVIALGGLSLPAFPAMAGEESGITMPDSLATDDELLVLNGMATRKKSVFKVYVAGLYLPARESDADVILASDTARHIVLRFKRGVGPEKIMNAFVEGLEENMPDAPDSVATQFARLGEWMEKVEKHEELIFSYRPGTGTACWVRGEHMGTLSGKPFADALFACFIGPHPGPGDKFKKKLMGLD